LQRMPEEVIESTDSLPQSNVFMFPNSENPLRGACRIDLQHFSSWDAGDVLNVIIRDYNTEKKWFREALAQYTIEEVSPEYVCLGFEDLGLEDSGTPWIIATPSGTPDAVTNVTTGCENDSLNICWNYSPETDIYCIYSSDTPDGPFEFTASVTGTKWQTSMSEAKKFYYVTAYIYSVKK